jgi:energy-coupling factor transport system permease protein
VRSSGRILALVASFLLLIFSTRPDALMQALRERGVPQSLAYILLTALQIAPRFQARAQTILDAQRSRGLETEGGLRTRIHALLPLIQPLILGSLLDVEERAMALEVRAFGHKGPKTYLLTLPDSRLQATLRLLLLLVAVVAVAGRLWWEWGR